MANKRAADASPARPSRGEIWDVDWSPARGSEQSGRRPALVVQNDFGNHSTTYPNTIVVAISTKGRDIPLHVRLEPSRENGLQAVSFVKCEQVLTISKTRLVGKSRGRLHNDALQRVDAALKRSLDLS
jgi:mRNA interferase MazF